MQTENQQQSNTIMKSESQLVKEQIIINTVVYIAFNQGIQDLAEISVRYLFKDDFQLQPATSQSLLGWAHFAWIIKPLWGYISDTYPFLGYRRKSYVIFWSMLQWISWLSLAFYIKDPYIAILFICLIYTGLAFNNVIGEAIIVEIARDQPQGTSEEQKQEVASKNVSLFFFVRNFGTFVSSYLGGLLLLYVTKFDIFAITSVFPLLLWLYVLRFPEQKIQIKPQQLQIQVYILNYANLILFKALNDSINYKSLVDDENKSQINNQDIILSTELKENDGQKNLEKLIQFVLKPQIFYPILFVFISGISPSTSSAMFYFYTNELKFQPEFLGQIKLVTSLAAMGGIWLYHNYMKTWDIKFQLFWTTVIGSMLGMSVILLVTRYNLVLGIPDKLFIVADSFILVIIGQLNSIPILVFSARICPKNIEGTMYALLTSVQNFSSLVSEMVGAYTTYLFGVTDNNFSNLWQLVLMQNLFVLLPLPILYLIDFKNAEQVAEADSQEINLVQDEEQQSLIIREDKLQIEIQLKSNSFLIIQSMIKDQKQVYVDLTEQIQGCYESPQMIEKIKSFKNQTVYYFIQRWNVSSKDFDNRDRQFFTAIPNSKCLVFILQQLKYGFSYPIASFYQDIHWLKIAGDPNKNKILMIEKDRIYASNLEFKKAFELINDNFTKHADQTICCYPQGEITFKKFNDTWTKINQEIKKQNNPSQWWEIYSNNHISIEEKEKIFNNFKLVVESKIKQSTNFEPQLSVQQFNLSVYSNPNQSQKNILLLENELDDQQIIQLIKKQCDVDVKNVSQIKDINSQFCPIELVVIINIDKSTSLNYMLPLNQMNSQVLVAFFITDGSDHQLAIMGNLYEKIYDKIDFACIMSQKNELNGQFICDFIKSKTPFRTMSEHMILFKGLNICFPYHKDICMAADIMQIDSLQKGLATCCSLSKQSYFEKEKFLQYHELPLNFKCEQSKSSSYFSLASHHILSLELVKNIIESIQKHQKKQDLSQAISFFNKVQINLTKQISY